MKTILSKLLLTLPFQFIFSQKLNQDSISFYPLNRIYKELSSTNYTLEEVKQFATLRAGSDVKYGIKKILVYSGPYDNYCEKCRLFKQGFVIEDFAPADIAFEKVDVFVENYNSAQKQANPIPEKDLMGHDYPKNHFSTHLTTLVKTKISWLNDSTFNFKFQNDTLEKLFKQNISKLIVEITDPVQNKTVSVNYFDASLKGIDINYKKREPLKLFVTLDFTNVPNNFSICWCSALQKKYGFVLPVKFK